MFFISTMLTPVMAFVRNERSSWTCPHLKKPQIVALPKQNIALFLHSNTMSVFPLSPMAFFKDPYVFWEKREIMDIY